MVRGISSAPSAAGDADDGGPRSAEAAGDRAGGERAERRRRRHRGRRGGRCTPVRRGHCADQEDDLDRGGNAAEEVGGGGRGRDGPQQRIAEHEAQAFRQCRGRASGCPPSGTAGSGSGAADGADGHGGDQEARRVDSHRGRGSRWPGRGRRRHSDRPRPPPARCRSAWRCPPPGAPVPTKAGRYDW